MADVLLLVAVLFGGALVWLVAPRYRDRLALRAAIAIPAAGLFAMAMVALVFGAFITVYMWD